LLAELALPGLVALFLGAAAVLVAGLRALGLVESVGASVGAWMTLSVALTLGLRGWMLRRMPGEVVRRSTDEQVQAFGTVVEVLETIGEGGAEGRIRHEGTSWAARSTGGAIPRGARAQLVVLQDLVWLVEPVPALGEGAARPLDPALERGARALRPDDDAARRP
jgi:membrane protein implicated in regulation of membrane protease activity